MPSEIKRVRARTFPIRPSFLLAIVLLGVGLVAFSPPLASENTSRLAAEAQQEAEKTSGQQLDFPSTVEGTFSAWVQERYFKDSVDPLIVFFSSEKIPGLSFVYYPEEQRLVAGMPPLVVEQVRFFDGQAHHLAYSFQRGGEQRLYYDGQLVGISSFVPKEKSFLTGMVVGTANNVVSEMLYDLKIG